MTPARERVEIRTDDGWLLRATLLVPEAPRAAAVLGHGMLVDRRTLDVGGAGLQSELAAHGIATLAVDLRGHGESGPLAAQGGRWSFDDLVRFDAPASISYMHARFSTLPCFGVGHSLFGQVLLGHAATRPDTPLAALALIASNLWSPDDTPSALRQLGRRAVFESMVLIASAVGHFPARRLRLGTADESAAYLRQSVGWVRRGGWTALDGRSYRAALPSVQMPVVAIASPGDPLADPHGTRRFVEGVPRHAHVTVGRASVVDVGLPGVEPPPVLGFDPDHMGFVVRARSRPLWAWIARTLLALGG